ncbi:MAG: VWA domain-containing protein [Bacteroidetes bacterium]|nr:VWA domain-containing protein [Bacteroidota bacterium]
MRFTLLLISLLLTRSLFSQITASETTHDFGDIYTDTQTYADIVFTNNTAKPQYLLTIDKPRDVFYIFSGKKLLPDSSIVIRFKINDGIKGKFTYQVDVYFSDSADPIPIILTGNIKETTGNPLTDCPDFNSNPPAGELNFSLVVKVIDSITREPIPNAQVYLVERGELVGNYSTNQKGIVIKNVPLGFYFITAEKNPYTSNYFEGYVNATRNYVEIELSYTEPELVIYEEPETIDYTAPDVDTISIDPVTIEDVEIVEVPEDSVPEITEPVIIEPEIIPPLTAIPDTLLDPDYFKYSNITFILDASSSMNSSGKMELLKLSMIELVKMLRPEDNITVLKYAAEVDLVLQHTSGDKKDEIIAAIKGIKTSGSTAGGDAIKTAYAMNREKFIAGGNNLIIIITDGVFNKGATDYDATIESNFKTYGTRFSVVGIKTTDFVAEHMQNIVKLGGGEFIEINTVSDAQTKLISEIRRTAYKG